MSTKKTNLFLQGVRDAFPVGLGYLAVSFSLGIAARNAGISALQGFVMSLLNNASAGEYAGITAIKSHAGYIEIAIFILIANARYLLMSCALSQHLAPTLSLWHRMLIGFNLTDEVFGLAIAQPKPLKTTYVYGTFCSTLPYWSTGTALGVIAGNLLPTHVVAALSAAIYGMFIAIVVPPAKQNRAVLVVVLTSFVISSLFGYLPLFSSISESMRIMLLTILISVAAALIHPVDETVNQETEDMTNEE